jgi:preprotein translocase subunit SecA
MAHDPFPRYLEAEELDNDYLTLEEIEKIACDKVLEGFNNKLIYQEDSIAKMHQRMNPEPTQTIDAKGVLNEIMQSILIRNIDTRWQEHLHHIDHLRTEVSVRSIGQKDPLLEFKHEAFALFHELSREIKVEIAHALFKFEVTMPEPELPQTQTINIPREPKKPKKVKKKREPISPIIDLSLLDDETK